MPATGIIIREGERDGIVRVRVTFQQFAEVKCSGEHIGAGIKTLLVREIPDVLGARPIERGGLLQLHQTDLAGPSAPVRVKARLPPDNGFDQEGIDGVTAGGGVNLRFELPALKINKPKVYGDSKNAGGAEGKR